MPPACTLMCLANAPRRRASLAVGAAPSLAAAGASLAAAFLEKGLDGGDAAVLQRLMGLLAAPLAQWGAAAQVRRAGAGARGMGAQRPPAALLCTCSCRRRGRGWLLEE